MAGVMNQIPPRSRVPRELADLVDRYCQGMLSEEEVGKLQEWIAGDSQARMFFVQYLAIHAGLQWECRRRGNDAFSGRRHPLGLTSTRGRLIGWSAVTALLVLMVAVGFLLRSPPVPVPVLSNGETIEIPSRQPASEARSAKSDGEIVVARLVDLESQVIVERNGLKQKANIGMDLLAHDALRIPQDATALLKLSNSASVRLGPQSVLAFEHEGRPELLEGFVEVNAMDTPKRLAWSIRTSMADTEIRSSRFTMAAVPQRTQVRVAEGTVNVVRRGDGAMAEVDQGYCSTVTTSFDLQPIPSRYGTALLIVSSEDHTRWAEFNRLVGSRLISHQLWSSALSVKVRTFDGLTPEDLKDCALVVISVFPPDTIAEDRIRQLGLPSAAIPILCLEPIGFPVLGMTGSEQGKDYQFLYSNVRLDIVHPEHPLAAGFQGKSLDLFHHDQYRTLGWARPVESARRIARLEGSTDQWVLFGFEQGDVMSDRIAPERRVGLFLNPLGVMETSPALNFIDAAIQWCVTGSPKVL